MTEKKAEETVQKARRRGKPDQRTEIRIRLRGLLCPVTCSNRNRVPMGDGGVQFDEPFQAKCDEGQAFSVTFNCDIQMHCIRKLHGSKGPKKGLKIGCKRQKTVLYGAAFCELKYP